MLCRSGSRCAAYVALVLSVVGCQPWTREETPPVQADRPDPLPGEPQAILAADRAQPSVLEQGPAFRRSNVVTFTRPGEGPGRPAGSAHIAVPVSLNGGPPRAFLLDTGAPVTTVLVSREVLDTAAVSRKLERADAVHLQGISGAKVTAYRATARSIAVGSTRTGPFPYVVMAAERDLGDLGDTPYGPVVGILGNDFLARYRVTVDFAGRTVSLEAR